MNREIFSVIGTGVTVYFLLRSLFKELKVDIIHTNSRLDDTWKELLVITREFAGKQKR